MQKIILILLILILALLTSCDGAKLNQKLSAETSYQKDMIITVNGVRREGMLTMPMKDKNQIHVIARGDLDMFVMSNCNAEWKKEKAWNVTEEVQSGWFGWGTRKIEKKREVEFSYEPKGIQRDGNCAVYLYGFSKDGKHSEGFIDWIVPEFPLTGKMLCNGVERDFEGIEACQSREGLYQSVTFNEEVEISPKEGCEWNKTEFKGIQYRIRPGICTYLFKSKSGKLGKLTTYGYNSILIRE